MCLYVKMCLWYDYVTFVQMMWIWCDYWNICYSAILGTMWWNYVGYDKCGLMYNLLPMKNDEYPKYDMKWMCFMIANKEEYEKGYGHDVLCICMRS